jgi:hypothetical protein
LDIPEGILPPTPEEIVNSRVMGPPTWYDYAISTSISPAGALRGLSANEETLKQIFVYAFKNPGGGIDPSRFGYVDPLEMEITFVNQIPPESMFAFREFVKNQSNLFIPKTSWVRVR